MNISEALTFTFRDEDWLKKLGIGALITLVSFLLIIPFPILIGYQIATMRNVMNGEKRPLPAWDNTGEMFVEGWKIVGVSLVYSLPLIILYGLIFGLIFALENSGAEDILGVFIGLAQCVVFIFSMAMALFAPAVLVQYARTGTFSDCFNFSEIYAFTRRNIGNVLLTIISSIVASLLMQIAAVISLITICGPIIVFLAGYVWLAAAIGHLYGQVALEDKGGPSKEELYSEFSY